MSNMINFELVSPEKKLVSQAVYMAVMPGDEGDFGALAGHCSLVASLRAGVVKLFAAENDNAPVRYFIAGGFADVSAGNCTVLAEEAVKVSDLNKDKLTHDLNDLREDLDMAVEAIDKNRIRRKIDLVNAKLAALA